jgi:hypothetical protein
MTDWAIQVLGRNPKCVVSTTWGAMMCGPNVAHGICTVETETVAKGAVSAPKGLGQKCSKASCATLASQSVSKHRAVLACILMGPLHVQCQMSYMDKWTCLKCELHPCHSFQERAMNISYNIEKKFCFVPFCSSRNGFEL